MDYGALESLGRAYLAVLVGVSVKSAVLAAVVTAGLRLARSSSPAFHHRVWLVVLVAMLVLPVFDLATPGFRLPVLPAATRQEIVPAGLPAGDTAEESSRPAGAGADHAGPTKAVAAPAWSWSWAAAIAGVHLAGAAASGLWFGAGLVVTRRRLRARRRVRFDGADGPEPGAAPRRVPVFECEGLLVPVAVGVIRPAILLSSDWRSWSPEKLRSVLAHERAHVARRDYAVRILALANRCLFWFHPVSWLVLSRLSTSAELACDEEAVREGSDPVDYAQHLLEIAAAVVGARARLGVHGPSMTGPTELARRVEALLDLRNEPRSPQSPRRARAVAAAVLMVAAALVAVRPTLSASAEVGGANGAGATAQGPDEAPRRVAQPPSAPAPGGTGPAPATTPRLASVPTAGRPGDGAARVPAGPSADDLDAQPPARSVPEAPVPEPQSALDGLGSPDAKVRQLAADAVARERDARGVLPLIRLLGDENAIVRQQSARALGRLGDARAVRPLIDSLGDASGHVREQAAESLGRLGARPAVVPLIGLLGDGNPNVRQAAARSLGQLGDGRAAGALAARSQDPNPFVRDEASRALEQISRAR